MQPYFDPTKKINSKENRRRPPKEMEDDLKKMEDDLKNWKMTSKNGGQPQKNENGRRPQFLFQFEVDLNFLTLIFI
jgi:hypothetical protein